MSDAMRMVLEFHQAFNLLRQAMPSADAVSDTVAIDRQTMLQSEVDELDWGVADGDLIAIADGLADIVYIAYGTAITYGIDLDAVLAEVHRSNMTKMPADGVPVVSYDGKVVKSSTYEPPKIAEVLAEQESLW
jgi:predicted HAD superfamily Cof-like phosphohydrolase